MPHRPVAVLCGGLLACLPLACSRAPESAAAGEEGHPAPVKAVAARKVKLGEWTDLLGTTTPLPDMVRPLEARVEGYLLPFFGDGPGKSLVEGQRVQAGQVIARFDDRLLQPNLDKARATVTDLEEQQKQAAYAVELAEIEVKRLEELARSEAGARGVPLVSRVEIDRARVNRLDALSKQKSLAARLEAARADQKALEAQLEYYTVRSPIAGRLGLFQVKPGQPVTRGALMTEVVNLDEIDVLCFVPPSGAARLALGQAARLGPDRPADGKVVFIAVQGQAETGNFAVKVRFPNAQGELRANSVVHVQVLTRPEKERWVIPEAALLEDQEPPAVMVAHEIKTVKNDKGEEEKIGEAERLVLVPGVRDREHGLVEVLRLEDDHGKEVPLKELEEKEILFIIAGGHGLKEDDKIEIEEIEPEKEHEEKHP
jgi:RND family efflux transporter MFP subunit